MEERVQADTFYKSTKTEWVVTYGWLAPTRSTGMIETSCPVISIECLIWIHIQSLLRNLKTQQVSYGESIYGADEIADDGMV